MMKRTTLSMALGIAAFASSAVFAQTVEMKTSMGMVVLELDAKAAPKSVENFLKYVEAGHYDGTIFHRVIKGFMAQGGGFTKDMQQKPTRAPVQHEGEANKAAGVKNDRGTLAMARTMDPHSATAQFFINYKHNAFLDHQAPTPQAYGYTVFGKVTSGMDIVDKMADIPGANQGGHQNVPTTPIIIEKMSVKK